jgi:hypothetical protein
VCFGSIVGYSAYGYALDRLPVAILSIYPYINAIVAVALGWLFYREPFGLKRSGRHDRDFHGRGPGQTPCSRGTLRERSAISYQRSAFSKGPYRILLNADS